MTVPDFLNYQENERKNGQTQSGTKRQKTQKDTNKAYRSGMKLGVLGIVGLLLLTGCASGDSEVSAPEVKSTIVPLSGEEKSQLRYCKSFDKAYGSLKSNGMTYETRDLFGDAYDIVHEQLLGVYESSRYFDYDGVMADHSFAWVSGSDVASLDGIATWCAEINTKLSAKTS